MNEIIIHPQNVCSREMRIIVNDENKVISAEIIGGCHGNTTGICHLLVGMDINEIINKLEGIECPGSRTRKTSCPDQLALGLKHHIGLE